MMKSLFVLMLGLMVLQYAEAQSGKDISKKKTDTTVYFMNNTNELSSRVNADYVLFIMPPDSNSKGLYKIQAFYANGKPKTFSTSINRTPNPTLAGFCMDFYPNGHKKSITNYDNGILSGEAIFYYPNGKIYAIENYDGKGKIKLIENRDTLGSILCKNGNGKWIKYTNNFQVELEEGVVTDSLEDGEWHSKYYALANYVTIYHKGIVTSTTDPNRPVGEAIGETENIIFNAVEKEPEFKGGLTAFYDFLSNIIQYPSDAKQNGVQGVVHVTFVVEKDGSLTNVKAFTENDKGLAGEAVRAVSLSPHWIPGMQNGKYVRVQYNVPISFTLPKQN